ncbi:MAG: DUF853 domain-containing protein [Lachnospiraceae bacterium]|nr:DUF853 domain-containing protein [Lachnospiraceae bacterium]
MYLNQKILIGKADSENVYLNPNMLNRHGLIAGATGTGKTVTLRVLAESLSDCGVPVFMADVKGDLASLCNAGTPTESMTKRVSEMNLTADGFGFQPFPVRLWDVYGEKGMPLRTTISEMGPLLLSRVMDLNPTQSDILTVIFKIADDEQLLLIDTKDLKAMLSYVSERASEYSTTYGNISKPSIAAITRAVVAMESEGADLFFGEPALDIRDWFTPEATGKGPIHILDCQKLITHPRIYAAFLLWMMSELFENLPEEGDLEQPKMVFFFDEAHMLFDGAPKALLEKIEQVVKLIRSKGVGIFFITQSPKDIPDGVLAQLGNKIQHALHAYTPAEQKAIKAAADGLRANPAFDTKTILTELGIGEALVSVLDESGVPGIVQKTRILPPQSALGALDDASRSQLIRSCPLFRKYMESIDRDSAYEFMQRRNIEIEEAKAAEEAQKPKTLSTYGRPSSLGSKVAKTAGSTVGRELGKAMGSAIGGSFGKTLGGNMGSTLGRGLLGSLFKF